MAKIYAEDALLFGPVMELPLPSEKQSLEEKETYIKEKKYHATMKRKGHQRVMEKIKELRQNFSNALTAGSRSGSGRIVYEFYDELINIWGGSPSAKPLSFEIASLEESPSTSFSGSTSSSCVLEDKEESDSLAGTWPGVLKGGEPILAVSNQNSAVSADRMNTWWRLQMNFSSFFHIKCWIYDLWIKGCL